MDRGLRVFGYYESSVRFGTKQRQCETRFVDCARYTRRANKIAGTDVQIEGKPLKMKILMRYVKTY